MPDIIYFASRLLNIFSDGFRDGPMWAAGLLIIVAWLIIRIYKRNKAKIRNIIKNYK